MKFIVIIAIGYIIYKMYRFGQINGAIKERNDMREQARPEERPSDKEYTDYEEIK
ncbi:MAG TPA: hypothetical protein PKY97_06015 [Saprospiraceae bacterium]|nr:hypothetical protein [Saprospiraceae bacterium]HRG43997.1 hypothetical protein [Saprospiraceae bacterium]